MTYTAQKPLSGESAHRLNIFMMKLLNYFNTSVDIPNSIVNLIWTGLFANLKRLGGPKWPNT